MKQLRCAIIGCGRIGCEYDEYSDNDTIRTHAGSYYNNKNVKLVALCDIDKKKIMKYGKKYNVKGLYTTTSEMYKNETIDCISICTRVDSHLSLVKEAAKYNVKGILLEKPISDSLSNARKIIDICEQNKIILAIDHQRRFDLFYHKLKKLLHSKRNNCQNKKSAYGMGENI